MCRFTHRVSRTRSSFNRWLYRKETGYLFNYLTLTISDPHIAGAIKKQITDQFIQIYIYLNIFAVFSTCINVANLIKNESQSQVQIVYPILFGVFFVLYLLLRNTNFRNFFCHAMLTVYLAVTGILINLALRDSMPFGLKADQENLDFFQGVVMFTYVLITIN
jgi:hypothetical protein